MWWIARKSTDPHFELFIDRGTFDCMEATLSTDNSKSRATLLIDQLRPYSPLGLKISLYLADYNPVTSQNILRPGWADTVPYSSSIRPGKVSVTPLLLQLPEDLRFSTRVSISVRIVKKSWTIPYKMKVVTAVVPAYIKKHHD